MTNSKNLAKRRSLLGRLAAGIGLVALLALGLSLMILGALFAINLSDEAPTDTYNMLANTPVVEAKSGNGFIAYVGSNAPAEADAMEWGAKWIAAHQSAGDKAERNVANSAYPLNALPFEEDTKTLCEPRKASCIEMARQHGTHWRELAVSNATLLKRQQALVDFPVFEETYFPPHVESIMPHLTHPARRLALSLISLEAAEGSAEAALRSIETRIAFDWRALDGARSLLSGMVAVSWLADDYALLADLLAAQPRLVTDHRSRLLSMTQPFSVARAREIASRLFEGEGRWQIRMQGAELHAIAEGGDGGALWDGISNPERRSWLAALSPMFLKPQATLNQLAADNLALRQRTGEFQPVEWESWLRQAKDTGDAIHGQSWKWKDAYNPVGKQLVKRMSPDHSVYLLHIMNLVGITRLARLQAELLAEKAPPAEIQSRIAADKGLYDPFTDMPMGLDAVQGHLYFDSIRSAQKGDARRVFAGLESR